MKRFIRVATLPALVLAGSLLAFGGDQTRIYKEAEVPDGAGTPQAVLQGKGGGGVTRVEVGANAYRAQTATDRAALKDQSGAVRYSAGDVAYRK